MWVVNGKAFAWEAGICGILCTFLGDGYPEKEATANG